MLVVPVGVADRWVLPVEQAATVVVRIPALEQLAAVEPGSPHCRQEAAGTQLLAVGVVLEDWVAVGVVELEEKVQVVVVRILGWVVALAEVVVVVVRILAWVVALAEEVVAVVHSQELAEVLVAALVVEDRILEWAVASVVVVVEAAEDAREWDVA